jgi:hypothetical protein
VCLASVPTLLYLSTFVVISVLCSNNHVEGHHSDNCVRVTFTVHVDLWDDANIDVRVDFDVDVNIARKDVLVTV